MILGSKSLDGFDDNGGHRHRINQVTASIGERRTFGRIRGDREQFVRRLGAGQPLVDPQGGRTECEIVAMVAGLGAV